MRANQQSNVQFLIHRPSSAITSKYVPFTTQEYKARPLVAISKTHGGAYNKLKKWVNRLL